VGWLPETCHRGHPLIPGKVHVAWIWCDCPGATHDGHQYVQCEFGWPAGPPCGDVTYLGSVHTGEIPDQR
jgi:hypothetical protein